MCYAGLASKLGVCKQVTNENKREYVDLVAEHRMTTAIRAQTQSFLKGYWEMVPKVHPHRSALSFLCPGHQGYTHCIHPLQDNPVHCENTLSSLSCPSMPEQDWSLIRRASAVRT